MKKYRILFLFAICIFLQLASSAETLKCGVEKVWTVGTARTETFKDLKPVLDLSWAPSTDPNFSENKQAINKNQRQIENRVITQFSDGGYGVTIFDDDNYNKVYYYSASGELLEIDFSSYPTYAKNLDDFLALWHEGKMFPFKVYKHDYPSGKIINATLTATNGESFMFKPSGELQYHWIGKTAYDINGKKVLTRNR